MKIETYLNAMLDAWYEYKTPEVILSNLDLTPTKRARQYLAFRARILKMDAEKDKTIKAAEKLLKATTTMKIDGWLTGEYDLPDQQDLIEAALEYNRVRKMRQL